MTYSIDYRKQVLPRIDNGLTVREAAAFYELSTSTIHSWRQILEPKKGRYKAPTKIPDDALLHVNISQKKDTRTSKSLSDKKS